MNNEFLKATLDTGAFCFAEGYFVLRDEKYVLPGEDALFLTEYARLHLSECTLDFSYKLVCSRTSVRDVHYMFRADIEYKNYRPMIPIRRTWTSTTRLLQRLWTMQTRNFRNSLSAIVWLMKQHRSGCASTWMRRIGTQVFSKQDTPRADGLYSCLSEP